MLPARVWPRWTVLCLLVAVCAFTAFDYGDRHRTPSDQMTQRRRVSDHTEIVQRQAFSPYRYRVLVAYALDPVINGAARFEGYDAAFRHVYDMYYLAAFVFMLWTLADYLRLWFTEEQTLIGALFVASMMGIGLGYDLFSPDSLLEPSFVALALRWTYEHRAHRLPWLTAVASLTRETAIFLPLAFILTADRAPRPYTRPTIVGIGAISLAISTAVFLGLRLWLGFVPHVVSLGQLWAINTRGDALVTAIVHVLLFLGGTGWLLAVVGARRAPAFTKRALLFALCYVPAVIAWGVWYEVRLLMPLYPVLVPLVLSALYPTTVADGIPTS